MVARSSSEPSLSLPEQSPKGQAGGTDCKHAGLVSLKSLLPVGVGGAQRMLWKVLDLKK